MNFIFFVGNLLMQGTQMVGLLLNEFVQFFSLGSRSLILVIRLNLNGIRLGCEMNLHENKLHSSVLVFVSSCIVSYWSFVSLKVTIRLQ